MPDLISYIDSDTAIFWLTLFVVFASGTLLAMWAIARLQRLWVERGERWIRDTDLRLQSLFLFTDVKRWLIGYLLVLLIMPPGVALWSRSILSAIVLLILLIWLPRQLIGALVKRRRNEITQALPGALSQIAGAMRAGSTFITAIQAMLSEHQGPLAQEFSLFLRQQRMGHSVADALQHLANRVNTEEMELVVSATIVSQSVGGNLAEILQQLADGLRDKIELEAKIRALTAQGVLQGRLVTMLPLLLLGALLYLEPAATWPIFTSVLGWGFLLLIACLLLAGAMVIRQIVNIRL